MYQVQKRNGKNIDFDLSKIDAILRKTKGLLDVLFLLAEQGAIIEGRKLEEDRAWFGAHAPASQKWIISAHEAIVSTLVDGMSMETDDADPDEEVDVVLEELKKKEEKTASYSCPKLTKPALSRGRSRDSLRRWLSEACRRGVCPRS